MPSFDENALQNGVVYRKSNGLYAVRSQEAVHTCELSNRLHKNLVYPEAAASSIRPHVVAVREIQLVDPVAIGDEVRYIPPNGGNGLIMEVLPRRSRLARREASGGRHAREQVIVANLDQVAPIFAVAQPLPSWNLLDRYLASAESLGLDALIVITKHDLAMGEDKNTLRAAVDEYRRIGYPVILTSAASGEGVTELRERLSGRITAFVGKSGVGKSSLLNAVQPGLGLQTSAVSQITGKGRHTTTHLELFPLDGEAGGAVADTPGMREFGLWQVDKGDHAYLFPEMAPFIGSCRFGLDCNHVHEPGCAVRKAVESGLISQRRYASMLRLREE